MNWDFTRVPCCVILTPINTTVFLLWITLTLILKRICSQRISRLRANHHNMYNSARQAALTCPVRFFPHGTDLWGVVTGCTEGSEEAARSYALSQLQHHTAAGLPEEAQTCRWCSRPCVPQVCLVAVMSFTSCLCLRSWRRFPGKTWIRLLWALHLLNW